MKWLLLFLFFFVISCTQSSFVLVDDTNIPVEIADSPEERMQGLMFRESLEGGMLFIFEDSGIYPFWMKNTFIPLDILWLDDDGKIVFIQNNALPCQELCPSYHPGVEARYVLELNAGAVTNLRLAVGDKVIVKV